ncbi:MAG: hypothetical protein ACRDRS_23245, partial [Pseudonocardiaceae bacterium]
GDLLPIGLGHHLALTAHLVLLVDGVADDLHQDQLLRPVGIKPDWQRYINQAQVDALVSDTYIMLAFRAEDSGRAIAYAERAEQHILNVRESRPQGFNRSGVVDEIRFAEVRLAQRDVAESVTLAQAALELAAPMSSTIISHRLRRLGSELTVRHPDNVHVIPLRERIHDYEQRVAPRKGRGAAAT